MRYTTVLVTLLIGSSAFAPSGEKKEPNVGLAATEYVYPGASLVMKHHDDADEGFMSLSYSAVYESPATFAEVCKWYKEKCNHAAKTDFAISNYLGIPTVLASDSKEKKGMHIIERPVSVLTISEYDRAKSLALSVVISRGKEEKHTHILISAIYSPTNRK